MIVIPMAGESVRFKRAGYEEPKYRLDLKGRPAFDYAVASFSHYFESEPFLFILRGPETEAEFVRKRLELLGVRESYLVRLLEPTQGQAETVKIGLEKAHFGPDVPITIFNIDTFRPGLRLPPAGSRWAGYLEVFRAPGNHWSFVVPDRAHEGYVSEVVEKERRSNLCSTGLYCFRSAADFLTAYADERKNPSQSIGEHYVAPMFNQLIRRGEKVSYAEVDAQDVILCGVPTEYGELLDNPAPLGRFEI